MIEHLRPQEWNHWLVAHREHDPLLLDVREPWEIQTASVTPDGFELLTIPMASIPQHISQLHPDRPIACLCHHGVRSLRVAQFLEQNGFSSLANITGGIDAWSLELDPSIARY